MIPVLHPRHTVSHASATRTGLGWLGVLFAIALVMLACGGSTGAVGPGSTTTSTSPSVGGGPTTTGSGGGTTPTTGTPTATATRGPGPTPTPVPFSVSSASVSASPANFNGQCASVMKTTFTATINVPAHTSGGTVTYHWIRSDGSPGPTQTLHFSSGDTWHTTTDSWTFGAIYGNGGTYWEAVVVTAPNGVSSSHGNATLTCQNHVTGASASVDVGSYPCGAGSQTFTFTGTISVSPSPGGSVTYTWLRSDGASGSSQTTTVP